jgi:chemotaxis protein MotB
MAGKRDRKGSGGIVIKQEEVVEGGHHGGAWKVAYADFVTAMMAFFLLMWLLNATTEEQRKGLADYFSPANLMSHASSGTGEPFGGRSAFDKGALVFDRGAVQITQGAKPVVERTRDGTDPVMTDNARSTVGDGVGLGLVTESQDGEDAPAAKPAGQTGQPSASAPGAVGAAVLGCDGEIDLSRMTPAEQEAERERLEKGAFEQAAQQIRDAVGGDPALADLVKQLSIDMTPEGLRIQIMDEVKLPMFPSGSAEPNERVRLLMQKIVPVLLKLSEPISITGHTDAAPFRGPDRTNWELSTERANATRRLLVEDGLPEARLRSVTGLADRDPLLPGDPLAAANRRIAILVLRHIPQAAPMAETRPNRS